jgi:hypothetical protein
MKRNGRSILGYLSMGSCILLLICFTSTKIIGARQLP